MAQFSVNQVRQVYVAKKFNGATYDASPTAASPVGTLGVVATKDKDGNANGLVVVTKGEGGITRSDIVEAHKIVSVGVTGAASMEHKMKRVKIVPVTNSPLFGSAQGNPVESNFVGQDIIVRIEFRQFISIGEEDTYMKHGVVRTYTGMTKQQFFNQLAQSIANNQAREITPLVKVFIGSTEIKPAKKASTTATGDLIIEEAEQDWVLGTKQQYFVNFNVVCPYAQLNGTDIEVLEAVDDTANGSTTIKNGKYTADFEYFAMGDRADLYRNIGWPNVIPSKLLVDPTKEYDYVDIVYYYSGNVEDVQKSRKAITILAEKGEGTKIKTVIDGLFTAAPESQVGEVQGE